MAERRRVQGRRSRAVEAACAALVLAEIAGYLAMLAPIPVVWMWVGGQVFEMTGSLGADLLVAFGGFLVSIMLTMRGLTRIDQLWVDLRRRAGHDQRQGVLTKVVVILTSIAFVIFWIWFHILESAFIIPFMPLN